MSSTDHSAATTVSGEEKPKKKLFNLSSIQKFGRSLLLPIASLPAAALLMRLGEDDLLGDDGLGWTEVASIIGPAGEALFEWLPLLFAVGVAIGMARKADGSTALAAVIGFMVYHEVTDAMSAYVMDPADLEAGEGVDFHVLGGIVIGLTTAFLWQRYYRIKLPPYLAFFGGRRFVPMITALAAIILGVLMSFIYQYFDAGITLMGEWVTENAVLGGFVYGFANRLLIPLGLHHILNNPPWFMLGSYEREDGSIATGDIERFLSGDPTAGIFMTGFFPIMMFALPAAALAIWHSAKKEHRKVVGGGMISVALTSFLTGVTEPLEFAFMFVAFPLYVLHAFLTGTAMALVNFLEIKAGFGFSAGLFDYVLNWNIATDQQWLIPIGLGYAIIYYVLFRLVIHWWNLKTPGREDDDDAADDAASAPASESRQ